MCASYWKFHRNIQWWNKKILEVYAPGTNSIFEASESTDSKWRGRAGTMWKTPKLRIDGVPVQEKGRSQDVFEHVVRMFGEAGAVNFDGYIDRAHRIGKNYFDKNILKKMQEHYF